MRGALIVGLCLLPATTQALGDEAAARIAVDEVVAAAGGRDKLLTLFRFTERLNVSSDETKPAKERESVVEPPDHWWLGKKQRVGEPASYLVWVWTLGALVDERSKVEVIDHLTDGDAEAFGLRISESITPPLDAYFRKSDKLLLRIDWRSDIHRFSEWREHDGVKYPAKCVGYKTKTGKPWYFSEIIELERLEELPPGLAR